MGSSPVPQRRPTAALVQRAEPVVPAHHSRSGEPVSVPVHDAAETGSAQTHRPHGQIFPVQQAGLELVRKEAQASKAAPVVSFWMRLRPKLHLKVDKKNPSISPFLPIISN